MKIIKVWYLHVQPAEYSTADPHVYIPRWEDSGWDGTIEEVTA